MRKIALSVIMMIFVVAACTANKAYVAAGLSHDSYTSTMTALGEMYNNGELTEAQKESVRPYSDAYVMAHNTSVEAFATYLELKDSTSEEAYIVSVEAMQKALLDFLTFTKKYLKEAN